MFKVQCEGELHILSRQVNFTGLKEFVRGSFRKVPQSFQLYYYDSEGDKIELTSDDDLTILYQLMGKSEKIYIEKLGVQEI